DLGRHDRVDRAAQQAVALQPTQGQREHALADALDLPAELGEALGAAAEQLDHQQRPLVAQPVEHLTDLAGLALLDLGRPAPGSAVLASLDVTGYRRCAAFHRSPPCLKIGPVTRGN